MAKKKLNKRFAAITVISVVTVCGTLAVTYFVLVQRVRPAQRKAAGEAALAAGDYQAAYDSLSGVGTRLAGDVDFLWKLYKAESHLTSFRPEAYWHARGILDNITTVQPDQPDALHEKLRVDLLFLDRAGVMQANGPFGEKLADTAGRVLRTEPANVAALRAQAAAQVAPLLDPAQQPASAAVQAMLDSLAASLKVAVDDPDLVVRYAQLANRLRDALVRERAADAGPNDARTRAIGDDVDARITALVATVADESRPAPARARAAFAAIEADQALARLRGSDRAAIEKINQRLNASLASAVSLADPADREGNYLAAVRAQAAALQGQNRGDDAEALLRKAVDAVKPMWTPRMALAQVLADRGKAAEAVEVLSADLQPSTELVGVDGVIFINESLEVPLRRAFARIQSLDKLPVDQRDAAIASAEQDFKSARIPESDPRSMQVRAGLQEVRRDRTGAIQTLNRALQANPGDQLRQQIMSQLVSLNLALGQTGAAVEVLEQLVARNPSPLAMLQLIQLNQRIGRPEVARELLKRVKGSLPADNPLVTAVEFQLATDPAQRTAMLDRFPETNPAQAQAKLRLAGEGSDFATARKLGDRLIKAFPDAAELRIAYAEILLRGNDRAGAQEQLSIAQKAKPDDKQIAYLLATAQATSATQRAEITDEFVGTTVTDPYRRALIDAERARVANDDATYLAKLQEADGLDKNGEGVAADRLFVYALSRGKLDEAQKHFDRLAATRRDPAQIRVARVRLMLARNEIDAAAAEADRIVAELPGFSGGHVVRGLTRLARADTDLANQKPLAAQAQQSFEAALESEPANVETLRLAIEAADRAAQPAAFKRLLDRGLTLAPRDPQFVDAKLRYDARFGNAASTIAPRKALRDANPNQPGAWLNLIQAYLDSARTAIESGDEKAAAGHKANALATANEAATKLPNEPAILLAAARQRIAAGDAAGAEALAGRLTAEAPFSGNANVQAALGQFYLERGLGEPALAAFERALSSGSTSEDVRQRIAQLRGSTGDVDGALQTLDAIAKPSPATRELRVNLLLAANRAADAAAYAEQQLAADRSNPNLLLNALLKARSNDVAGAKALADEAVTKTPDDAAARYARARFALAAPPTNNDAVIDDLRVVRQLNTGNIEAWLLLSERLEVADKPADARQELEALLAAHPGQPQATARLINQLLKDRPLPRDRINDLLARAKRTTGANDPGILTLESAVALNMGDNDRAVTAARAAAAAAPDDMAARTRLYATMFKANASQAALAELDKRQGNDGNAYWHHQARGVALHRLKREPEAQQAFDRAIELAKSLVDDSPIDEIASTYASEYGVKAAATWVGGKLPEGPRRQATLLRMYASAQDHASAVAAGEGLIGKLDGLPPQVQFQALTDLGTASLGVVPPRAADARQAFERLATLDGNSFMTLNNLAYAMTLEGSGATPQQAAATAKQAYDAMNARGATGLTRAYVGDTYGWTLIRSGEIEKGVGVLREARQVQALPEIDYHLGEAAILQQQGAAARESLQNALAKVQNLKQNRESVDPSLEARITDAVRRAQALP